SEGQTLPDGREVYPAREVHIDPGLPAILIHMDFEIQEAPLHVSSRHSFHLPSQMCCAMPGQSIRGFPASDFASSAPYLRTGSSPAAAFWIQGSPTWGKSAALGTQNWISSSWGGSRQTLMRMYRTCFRL